MPSILITGKPGEGKTHFAMKRIKQALAEGRPVYTNIDGIKLDVSPIPVNKNGELDWTLTQEANKELGIKGALIVYDEAQKLVDNNDIRYFAYANREKLSNRDVIKEIEYHRHSGRDLIFITQSPKFLHLHLLELINEHYHLTRLRKEKRSQVSLWRTWQQNPDSQAAIDRAEDIFFEKFDTEIFKEYKSTEAVTDGKIRIPAHYYKLGAIAVICIGGAIALLANALGHFSDGRRIGQPVEDINKAKEQLEQRDKNSPSSKIETDNANVNQECRKAENVDKPECIKWFDDLTKNNASVLPDPFGGVQVIYDPTKPYDLEDIQKTVRYEVTQKPLFSGCIKKNGKYYGYTQQGTLLDVSTSDCRKLIEDGDRPFNYFKENNNAQLSVQATDTKLSEPTNELSIQEQPYQAQNYIEPHLQAKTVNGANSSSFSF